MKIGSGAVPGAMPAGDYEMKMAVSLDGKVVGETSHTFRRK
jgi:hypothetical protein